MLFRSGVHAYLMEQARAYLDYVSIHSYALNRGNELPRYDYLTAIGTSEGPEFFITNVANSLKDRDAGARIKIAYDEWNLRAWQHPGFPRDGVESYDAPAIRELVERREKQNGVASQYTLADALFSASFFNACLRHAEDVGMSNIAPIVNTRGPLFVHSKGIVKRTHFHAMAMYANELEPRVGKLDIQGDKLAHGGKSIPVVDAIATVNDSGKSWAIALVNRHPDQAVTCTVKMKDRFLDGEYAATVLAGDSADAFNDIEHPNQVTPQKTTLTFTKGVASLSPHSLIIIKVSSESPKETIIP